MDKKILVIGSANADYVIHSPKFPKPGETLTGSNFAINAGGKGLNQAIAIAKLGGNVNFLGALGKDSNGDMLLNELKQNGVSFTGIRSSSPTGIAIITVSQGENYIILNEGANKELTKEAIENYADMIKSCDYCVLQLEIPVETVVRICEIAKSGKTKIVLNPAPYKKIPEEIFPLVDYLIPNEHEAEDLTGIVLNTDQNCKKAVERLLKMGVKNVIITLGERGCVYNAGDDTVFCPAKKVKAVDTTSAGDCFIGAVISKLCQNNTIEQAIDFASKASAITVSREGASKSIPLECEVR